VGVRRGDVGEKGMGGRKVPSLIAVVEEELPIVVAVFGGEGVEAEGCKIDALMLLVVICRWRLFNVAWPYVLYLTRVKGAGWSTLIICESEPIDAFAIWWQGSIGRGTLAERNV
jgi:hypothetical protein